jgi:autotransporter-associated beta strand protein
MKIKLINPPAFFVCLVLLAFGATVLRAGNNDTWNGQGGNNNWGTPGNWAADAAPSTGDALFFDGSNQLTASNNLSSYSFAGLNFNPTAGAFTLTGNQITTTAAIIDKSPNLETINLPMAFSATHSLTAVAGGTMVINGAISGSSYGVTVNGFGTVSLTGEATGANTYTGSTAVNAGTLLLDFTTGGSTPTANIISSSSPLSLGGGTLLLNSASSSSSQTFNGTTLASGESVVTNSGTGIPTITLGSITPTVGGVVMFVGPATTNSLTSTSVPATATIKTTTAGTQGGVAGLLGGNGTTSGSYATVGLYDWASTDLAAGTNSGGAGSSPYTIIGGSQVAGFYTAFGTGDNSLTNNVDFTAASSGSHNTDNVGTMRFNTPGAFTFSPSSIVTTGGILVTPAVGSANVTISGNSSELEPSRGGATTMVIWQNNINGLLIASVLNTFNDAKSGAGTYVLAGLSTVQFTGLNAYTGPTYIDGGAVALIQTNALGNVATAATVTLNGGSIVAGATFALDNNPANNAARRPIVLGNNGGGLGASNTCTLTVDGQVSGTGGLTIGIPANADNNYTVGLVPGTGGNSPNSPVYATGTVVLNSTNGNAYSGGTTILDGTTLNINSEWQLGGSVYGGITFTNGTLQYASTLMNTTIDISQNSLYTPEPVAFAGNATIDVNGHSIAYTNSIGNNGVGALTVMSTIPGGTLNLLGTNTWSGGTTISNSVTLLANNTSGSATGSGGVTVQSGGTLGGNGAIGGAVEIQSGGILAPGNTGVGTNTIASLQLDSGAICNFEFNGTANDQTVVTTSGGLTINGGVIYLYVAGGTSPFYTVGTYNLFKFSGSIGGSGPGALSVGNPQTGYTYTFGTSGAYVTLQIGIASSVDIGTWTVNSDGNWSLPGNWTATAGTMPPHKAGDSATFGVSSSLRNVTLNTNESVGGITMSNINSFVIVNAGKTLTLDNSGNGAHVFVTGGVSNSIQTAVALNDNATVAVSSNQSLSISGAIANASSNPETLTVSGAGTLALSGNNSYGNAPGSGFSTTNSGTGTLQVGNNNALGAGDVIFTGSGTLQAAAAGLIVSNNIDIPSGVTLTVSNNGYNFTLDGNITDSGALTETGNGKLTLNGNNSYSGNTTINAGVLSISQALANSAAIFLNGGDLLANGTFSLNQPIYIGPASGSTGATALIDAASGQQLTLDGAIAPNNNSGANNLTVNGGAGNNGTVILGASSTFNGTTVISNGALQVSSPTALQDSTLNYNKQGGFLVTDQSAITLAGLIGSQNLGLTNLGGGGVAMTVNNTVTNIYSGDLYDAGLGGALTLGGSSTMILAGTNSYTGATTVSGGVLELSTNAVLACGAANCGGGELIVSGGSLISTNASSVTYGAAVGLLVSSGSATFLGGVGNVNNKNYNELIEVTGGTLTATNITLGRYGTYWTTQPTYGTNVAGLYVDGGVVNILNNLDMSSDSANASSVNARIDGGSVTVGGAVIIGLNNGGRWSVLDVTGGSLTVTDTNTGISVGGPYEGNAELLVRGGTVTAGIIGLGQNVAASDNMEAVVNLTGGSLYVGSGGIVQAAPVSTTFTNSITLYGGILGATTNWSCTNNIVLGTTNIIQTADASGNPWTISLSGVLSGGNLVKSGAGTLALSGVNTYTGSTTISNGTLALISPGSIASTPQVSIGAGATFDVSALGGFAFTGASPVQTLAATGKSGTASIAAGANTLTLNSGALASFQAVGGATPTVGKISVAGNLTLNSNVVTVNINTSTLGAGTNRLLDCTGTLAGSAYSTPTIAGSGVTPGAAVSITTTPGTAGHVDLVVGKATPTLETAPTASTITSGQALTNSTLSGGAVVNIYDENVPGTFAFTTPNAKPGLGTNTESVTFTPTDSTDYNSITLNVSVTVVSPLNPVCGPVQFTFTNSTLNLSWPTNLGYTLQTNSVLTSTNWGDWPGSASLTNLSITVKPTQNIFFRLSQQP